MNKYYHGVAIVLLAAFSSALMPTFVKFAYNNDLTVMTVLFFRFSLAAVVLFSFLLITKQNIRLDRRTFLGLFFLGAVFNTLQAACYFSSLKYIPASLAVLISYTYPTITAIVTCLWDHEPITKNIAISLISSFAGLILMLGNVLGHINILGIILATGASLFYTVYVVLGNKILKKVPPFIASSYTTLFTTVGTLFLSLFSANKISFVFPGAAWPWVLGLVFFSTFTIIGFFKGIKILGPTKASVLCTSEPLFGVVIAIILFHEHLTGLQLLGAAAVITGALLAVYTPNKDIKQVPPAKPHLAKSATS
ncbi:MAG: DMT family transporter [Dehalobacterium sp.]